jgi:GT2 family glycosyltransferase
MDELVQQALAEAARDRRRAGQIVRLYRLVLGRPVDPGGLIGMIGSMRQGASLVSLVSLCLASEEFRRRPLDAPTTPGGVDEMFVEAFGHPPRMFGERDRSRPVEAYMALLLAEEPGDAAPLRLTSMLCPDGIDPADAATYRHWLSDHHIPDETGQAIIRAAASTLPSGLAVSVLLVGNTSHERAVAATVDSLHRQLCDRWELIAIGPPSFCDQVSGADHRVSVQNVIGDATLDACNSALAICRGTFVILINEVTGFADDAVYLVGVASERDKQAIAVYADYDQVDEAGRRSAPTFATGWDPDLACLKRVGFPSLFLRTELARAAGGLRGDYLGCEWHDLVLRVTDAQHEGSVAHLQKPLISLPAGAPLAGSPRLASGPAERATWERLLIDRAAARADSGVPAPRLERLNGGSRLWLKYPLPRNLLISVIIPTRDKVELLRDCLDGLLLKTDYRPLEILVIDNLSQQPETHAYLDALRSCAHVRVLSFGQAFNWGAINNLGVAASRGEVIVLLNNDTTVLEPGWLTELASHAMRAEIGAVGPILLYPDGTVQHAGIICGPDAGSRHRFRSVGGQNLGYDGALGDVRDVSAVTGACVAMRRKVFDEVGGIEQSALAVTWSDVDLCLRVRERGFRVIVTPFARLQHLELATRGADDTPERISRAEREHLFMKTRWPGLFEEDPHYNPNLHLGEGETRLAGAPRIGAGCLRFHPLHRR